MTWWPPVNATPASDQAAVAVPTARDWRIARIVAALCLALFVVRAYDSLRQESATFDETNYFGLGKYLLATGRWDVPGAICHPPLFFYLTSLPLLFVDTDPTVWRSDPAKANDLRYLGNYDMVRGQAQLSSPANHDDRLLTMTRLTMVATAVLLGVCVFAWSARLFGPWAGAMAVLLFTFCPNVLAHARLITPDIGLTTFAFITIYYLWRFLQSGRLSLAIAGGTALGLALLFKFTALLLLPIVIGLAILWWMSGRTTGWVGAVVLVALGLALLVIGYGGNLTPLWRGIEIQRTVAARGHPCFLFGATSRSGWWYYFIVAFFVKTPLPAIALSAMALVLAARKPRGAGLWIDLAFLLVPIAVVVAFFSVDHKSVGLRYILPIYPFLYVFISGVAQPDALRSGVRRISIAALLCWYVGASLWIHPHYLAYFNELVGGPSNGYKVLVDSNLDWGQGLKGLKSYMDEHHIDKVALSYFGTDSPDRYGIKYVGMPSMALIDRNTTRESPDPDGWFAISATNVQGVYFYGQDPFAKFRAQEPDATIGYSILLYRLRH